MRVLGILSIRFNKIMYLLYCMGTEAADNQFILLQKCKLFLLNLSRQSYILVSSKAKVLASQANYPPSYPCLFFTSFNDDFKDGHLMIYPCVLGKSYGKRYWLNKIFWLSGNTIKPRLCNGVKVDWSGVNVQSGLITWSNWTHRIIITLLITSGKKKIRERNKDQENNSKTDQMKMAINQRNHVTG